MRAIPGMVSHGTTAHANPAQPYLGAPLIFRFAIFEYADT
jgi:hypothetical protein